jgi:hypothetical protein
VAGCGDEDDGGEEHGVNHVDGKAAAIAIILGESPRTPNDRRGGSWTCPYGWREGRVDGGPLTLLPDPYEQESIEIAQRMAAEGLTATEICRHMNDAGRVSRTGSQLLATSIVGMLDKEKRDAAVARRRSKLQYGTGNVAAIASREERVRLAIHGLTPSDAIDLLAKVAGEMMTDGPAHLDDSSRVQLGEPVDRPTCAGNEAHHCPYHAKAPETSAAVRKGRTYRCTRCASRVRSTSTLIRKGVFR